MSPTSKITTYACFFGIMILFLFLGYSSINNIKSTKLDPETYYLAKFIDNGKELSNLSEQIFLILKKKEKANPNTPIIIEELGEETEELTQLEVVYEEIEKKLRKGLQLKGFIDKFEEQDFANKYEKAISYYDQATDIAIWVCEETLNDMNDEDLSTRLVPRFSEFKIKLGENGSKVKYYITRANNSLKK